MTSTAKALTLKVEPLRQAVRATTKGEADAGHGDGLGAWSYQDAISGLAANHSYVREAFAPFTARGTGTPQYLLQNGASYFGWLNKSLSKSQVEELLRIANYLAAPFGAYEFNLVN